MTDALREALQPCPFCGGKAEHVTAAHPKHARYIMCLWCNNSTAMADTREHAAVLWNRRTALQEPAPVVAREPVDQGVKLDVIVQGYNWQLHPDTNEVWGLVSGDQGYAPTGMIVQTAAPQAPVEPAPVVQPEDYNSSIDWQGEASQLVEDARRYQWLQAHGMRLPDDAIVHMCHHPLSDAEVNRYIDAAIRSIAKGAES